MERIPEKALWAVLFICLGLLAFWPQATAVAEKTMFESPNDRIEHIMAEHPHGEVGSMYGLAGKDLDVVVRKLKEEGYEVTNLSSFSLKNGGGTYALTYEKVNDTSK